jgi:hypothetical protein
MSRTSGFITKTLALLCSALLTTVPVNNAVAQSTLFDGPPATGWQSSKLSEAIVNDANRAVETLVIANQNGQLTASIVENAATSLQILWDHYQEIGLNSALEKELLNNQQTFMNIHPSDTQIGAYQSKLLLHGVHANVSQLRSIMDPSPETREQFLATVAKVGIYQAEMAIVAQLRAQAQELSSSGSTVLLSSRMNAPRGHEVLIASACAACFVLAGVGLATGCTITEIACAGAVGTCLSCAL